MTGSSTQRMSGLVCSGWFHPHRSHHEHRYHRQLPRGQWRLRQTAIISLLTSVMMTASTQSCLPGRQRRCRSEVAGSAPRHHQQVLALQVVAEARPVAVGVAVAGGAEARRTKARRVRQRLGQLQPRCLASCQGQRARRTATLGACASVWFIKRQCTDYHCVRALHRLRPRSAATPKFSTGLNGDALMSNGTPRGDSSAVAGSGGGDAEGRPSSARGVDLTGFTMFVDRM